MSLKTSAAVLSCVFSLAGCGGASSAPETPETGADESENAAEKVAEESESVEAEEDVAGPTRIPTECHDGDDPCTPDPKWVRKLCADVYPAVALYLFQESSPFTHGYISARRVKAVNASGGVTSGEEWLEFDEEVVFLYHRKVAAGGIQVSGSGEGFEAIRLDGSCVSLGGDEVRTNVPPKPKYVRVPWRYIGKDMQNQLRSLPSVKQAYIERRTECKGAFSGTVTDKCIKNEKILNQAIISALKSGEAKLSQPEKQPE